MPVIHYQINDAQLMMMGESCFKYPHWEFL